MSSTLREAYLNEYDSALKDPRFILLKPTDGCGWGNKLRALTLCFVFALCTKRILVVDDFLICEHFLPPEGTDWSIKRWGKEVRSIRDVRYMQLRLRPDDFDRKAWNEFESKYMDLLFPERLVVLDQSIGFIDALFRNPYHEPFLRSCGMETSSKLKWLGQICDYLLSRPTAKLRSAVKKLSRRLNDPPAFDFGVQFRSYYDVGFTNSRYLDPFLASVRKDIISDTTVGRSPKIYVLTDDPGATKFLSEGLGDLGRVISWPHRTIHTAVTNTGVWRQVERVLGKLFGPSARSFDLLSLVPSLLRVRPQTSVLAEWFLLGECRKIYSTFTSFAVFAAARTGNEAALMRFDTASASLAPLRNEEYFY